MLLAGFPTKTTGQQGEQHTRIGTLNKDQLKEDDAKETGAMSQSIAINLHNIRSH